MKTYTEHIFEELIDNSTEEKIRRYLERKRREAEERKKNMVHPKSKEELQDIIIDAIEKNGPEVDLNYIDVSGIEDMYSLFYSYYGDDSGKSKILQSFNGDISDWDVSSVKDMNKMFGFAANFNGDISDWDVSSVEDMRSMFGVAVSFNQNLSDWKDKLGSVTDMRSMFCNAISFNQNISGWDVTGKNTENMFNNCPINEEYKPKGLE